MTGGVARAHGSIGARASKAAAQASIASSPVLLVGHIGRIGAAHARGGVRARASRRASWARIASLTTPRG